MKFCSLCGGPVALPNSRASWRSITLTPKVIVGCLPTVGDRILLCKRAIEPRYSGHFRRAAVRRLPTAPRVKPGRRRRRGQWI